MSESACWLECLNAWVLRGGQKLLSRSVQRSTQRWDDELWRPTPREADCVYVPDSSTGELYAAKTHVRIDKARNTLGFIPAFDLKTGMARTAAWARWANLVSAEADSVALSRF